MADESIQGDKVLCFICNGPAVRRRIYCPDCGVWSHVSCADRKKCCDSTPSDISGDTVAIKNLIATINSLSATVEDMSELITENKKLRQEIEQLKSEKTQTTLTKI